HQRFRSRHHCRGRARRGHDQPGGASKDRQGAGCADQGESRQVQLRLASPGAGTPPHVVGELFRLTLSLDLVHVPYNGGGPASGSTLAGHTPISFGSMAPAVPLVKEGKLLALAIASKKRSPALPDVPTMSEAGYPEVSGESWFTVLVPAGMPKEIIVFLQRDIAHAIAVSEMKERLTALGYEPVASTPEEAAAQFRAEIAKWGKVIGEAGIKAQ